MNNKTMMRRRISAVDFALFELTEFLDTHPDDQRALQLREQYLMKRQELIHEYEQQCGPYIVTANDVRGNRWTWVENPWPWDFKGEE